MAAELFGGAALGAVAGELLKAVIAFRKRVAAFNSRFEHLELSLGSLVPRACELEELYKKRGQHHEILALIGILSRGKVLVEKCGKVHRFNYIWKGKLSKELQKLDNMIVRYCTVELQFNTNKIVVEHSLATDQLSRKFDTLLSLGGSSTYENGLGLPLSYSPPKPPSSTIGLNVPLRELKIKLKEMESVLVLCGPGGCGKTTLAKALCHDPEIKDLFGENIFFVTLSKAPNESALDYLRMKHLDVDSPKLVVLDDVWSRSEHLIERFLSDIPDLKVLVTSRFEFRRYQSLYTLKVLNPKDARKLFCDSAFHPTDTMPDAELLDKIIGSCGGFPIALTVVGKSLKGQPWVVWQKRALEMAKGLTIFDNEEVILKLLQPSVDDLTFFARESFLNLAAFPEDVNIPIATLIDTSVELYKRCPAPAGDMSTDFHMRADVHVPMDLDTEDDEIVYALDNICQLSVRNLVNMVATREDPGEEADSFCYEGFVTQHDLLRQLAIHMSNRGRVEDRARVIIEINNNVIPTEFWRILNQPSRARLVSITTDEKFTSSWGDFQLPNTEVLILNIRTKYYKLPNFMNRMNRLKVLIITNHGFYPTEIENLQIIGSLPSLRRIRFERISFRSQDLKDMHLPHLMKLSFVMCGLGQALRNCSVSERLPCLKELDISYCDDLVDLPAGVCDSASLRKLSITNCHKLSTLPDRLGNLLNLEVLRLHNCIELLELPDSLCYLLKLKLLDISDCYSLEQLPEQFGVLPNLKTLIMSQCWSLSDLPFSVVDFENLKQVYCDGETANLWKPFKNQLRNLNLNVQKKGFNLKWLSR